MLLVRCVHLLAWGRDQVWAWKDYLFCNFCTLCFLVLLQWASGAWQWTLEPQTVFYGFHEGIAVISCKVVKSGRTDICSLRHSTMGRGRECCWQSLLAARVIKTTLQFEIFLVLDKLSDFWSLVYVWIQNICWHYSSIPEACIPQCVRDTEEALHYCAGASSWKVKFH